MQIFDVSTPCSPIHVSTYPPHFGGYFSDVLFYMHFAIVADRNRGEVIFLDVMDPAHPAEDTSLSVPSGSLVERGRLALFDHTLAVAGDSLYLLDLRSQVLATVDLEPEVLNLSSQGRWITCYLEFPEPYTPADVDISTVLLEEAVPAESAPVTIGDYDSDGISDLMIKFDRSATIGIVKGLLRTVRDLNIQDGVEVTVEVSGEVGGLPFHGTDEILWRDRQNDHQPDVSTLPHRPSIRSVYPNPFNPATRIAYTLASPANVDLMVYDMKGRVVRRLISSYQDRGEHTVEWDGRNARGLAVASGTYIIRLRADDLTDSGKAVILK